MKKIICLLLTISLFSFDKNNATSLIVDDSLNLFSNETINIIEERSEDLLERCESKIIVKTNNNINEDLSTISSNDVILILLNENEYHIKALGKYEKYFSENTINYLIKYYFFDYFNNHNYDEAINKLTEAIYHEILNYNHLLIPKKEVIPHQFDYIKYLMIAIAIVIIILIILLVKNYRYNNNTNYVKNNYQSKKKYYKKGNKLFFRLLKRNHTVSKRKNKNIV